jgi:alpha-glucosidase (family GH31 glycosyl hydrolase)
MRNIRLTVIVLASGALIGTGACRTATIAAGGPGGDETSGAGGSVGACGELVSVPAARRVSNGHPLLPPKWAFGVLWGTYYDQTGEYAKSVGVAPPLPVTLQDAAAKIRDEYAGDLMWIDSTWLYHVYGSKEAGANYLCFKFDPTTFPEPTRLIRGLREQHFHFGVWTWPWMGHGCSYFDEGQAKRYFVMNGDVPAATRGAWHGDRSPAAFDFTNPQAFAWWQGLIKPLTDAGLDFFKLDAGDRQAVSWQESGGKLADPSKNYVYEYHRAEYEATRAHALAHDPLAKLNGARGLVFPKQRAPHNDQLPGWWTNDIPATFEGMLTEMKRARSLNTPDSAAYWCGDTGGYSGAPPSDELYVRWLEYSTFTPLQEYFGARDSSGSIGARWPWLFGPQAQAIQKQYSTWRYRLLPFRYSNAQAAYHEPTVVYPVRWIGDKQIVSGNGTSDILVQPISAPGQTTTSVALPAGSAWIHYWSGKSYPGGTTATIATPLDQAAVFIKAGSIIPLGPALKYVDEKPADHLTLDVYPAGKSSYRLYEDDGISEGYLGGAYSTTLFTADDSSGHVTVAVDAQRTARYAYAGQLCSRTYELKINGQPAAPSGVSRDGHAVASVPSSEALAAAGEGFYYDATAMTVWVKFKLDSHQATRVALR